MEAEKGQFINTTILDHVTADMPVASAEIFGPVVCVIRFKDAEEALKIANGTEYGLSAGVFTRDYETAINVSRRLQAGTVWINTYRAISYMSPFGGYKRSGIGRENGQEAIREFMQTKSVWISTASEVPNPFVMR